MLRPLSSAHSRTLSRSIRRLAMGTSLSLGLILSPAAGAQNLLQNGGFDEDLSGWQFFSDGLRVLTLWQEEDAGGNPDSGSVSVTNFDEGEATTQVGLLQCVPVTSGQTYDLRAALRLPPGQAAVGLAEATVFWFTSASCSGFLSDEFGFAQGNPGSWVDHRRLLTAPAGAQGARINLRVFKETGGGGLGAHFDSLFFGREGTAPPCTPDARTLCLNDDRFKVTANWRRTNGEAGTGTAVELTGDTGFFWFFNPANVEMIVKVLTGCSNNGHYWVFAGGLTNVEVELRVEDTQTAMVRTYTNPQRTPFQPLQDTSAFETCP